MGEEQSQGLNPAWNDLLNLLPQDLHSQVTPVLQGWDKRAQDMVQEVHSKYEPYKPLLENNVEADYIDQAIYVMQQLSENPQVVLDQAIEAFGLPYVKNDNNGGSQVTQQNNEPDPFEELGIDITKHPQFVAMQQALEQINGTLTQQQQAEQQRQMQTQMEQQLEALHNGKDGKRVEFDDTYVLALMSAGVDPEKAVEQYQQTVNAAVAAQLQNQQQSQQNPLLAHVQQSLQNQQQKQQPFTVLGGDTGGGSGMANQPPDFGAMQRKDVNSIVTQLLLNQKNQG